MHTNIRYPTRISIPWICVPLTVAVRVQLYKMASSPKSCGKSWTVVGGSRLIHMEREFSVRKGVKHVPCRLPCDLEIYLPSSLPNVPLKTKIHYNTLSNWQLILEAVLAIDSDEFQEFFLKAKEDREIPVIEQK